MKLGVIGYGTRISGVIKDIIKEEPDCYIAAITDVRNDELRRDAAQLGIKQAHFYNSAEDMIGTEQLDGILIGTRCSLHTEMALKVLRSGIPLFLE